MDTLLIMYKNTQHMVLATAHAHGMLICWVF